jgi:lysophospholipase L1-like esterase
MAAVVISAIAALLLLAEGAFRVRQNIRYGTAETVDELYAVDATTGLRVPIPGTHFGGRLTINHLGFRGPEIAVPKPPGTVRIAFLGASTTFCMEVSSDEKVWPDLVTKRLEVGFPARRFDYVNGGVPGYGVQSSLSNLRRRVEPLDPDIIVIYEGLNDLSGELQDLAMAAGLIKDTKWSRENSWLARHSLLWGLAEKNFRVLKTQRDAREKLGRLTVETSSIGSRFRKDLDALVAESKKAAKIVAVASIATQLREDQTKQQQMRAAFFALYYVPFMTPDALIASYARYNAIIAEIARKYDVLLIAGEETIPGDSAHFTDTIHFSDAGSELMAARVASTIMADSRTRLLLAH